MEYIKAQCEVQRARAYILLQLTLKQFSAPPPKKKIFSLSFKVQNENMILIENKFGKSIKSFPQFNSILESSSIIQQSKMLISSDTAMIHLSDAAQTPVLGLFSADNRNVSRYKPFWVKNKIVQSDSLSIKNINPKSVFSEYNKLVVD